MKKAVAAKAAPSKTPKPLPLPPPQVWLTMMWHIGFGLPWCWKLGPSNDSERTHVKEMLETEHFLDTRTKKWWSRSMIDLDQRSESAGTIELGNEAIAASTSRNRLAKCSLIMVHGVE